ncbi:MAG: helix-turn-helix domain-containing protein [Actinomycetia bacterium]|nr:helix-turn-helix domain-containing protein [Actinomycetes bacterium]MCP4225590.1 helix-turn-helix domain-containing protein [Actinomycetes bacterium]MCP5033931.1 helix-turn-helix domain-containing protein [Actinomycetes bacterium]
MLKLSQQQVADRLSVRPTALSNWELGARSMSLDMHQIDEALEADGVLAGLMWALATPEGLEPSRAWTNVFPGPSTPVWMWIRTEEPSLRIEAEWGVFRLESERQIDSNGLFITLGASVKASPVVVQLSARGWVDFGRGEIPSTVPDAEVIGAISLARPSSATGVFMDLFSAEMADRFKTSHPREIASLTREAPNRVTTFFERFTRPHSASNQPRPPMSEGIDSVERMRFAKLRKARGLSLAETADRLTALTDVRASKDTLRRFENDEGEPHDRLLPAALDQVLGANGHLAIAKIHSGQGPGIVRFPSFWLSPMWLSLEGESMAVLELYWGSWWRKLSRELPMLVISHYAEPAAPLRIVADPGVRWTAGLGRMIGAIPINQDWAPTSYDAAQQALIETEDAVIDAIRLTNTRDGSDLDVRGPDQGPQAGPNPSARPKTA